MAHKCKPCHCVKNDSIKNMNEHKNVYFPQAYLKKKIYYDVWTVRLILL